MAKPVSSKTVAPYPVRNKGRVSPPSASSALQEREAMLREVRIYASQQGLTPRPFAVEQLLGAARVGAVFRAPERLLLEAKLLPQRFTPNELLAALQELTVRIGHKPTEAEVDADLSVPAAMVYRHHFGSLDAAFQQFDGEDLIDALPTTLLGAIESGRGHRVRRGVSAAEHSKLQENKREGRNAWRQVRVLMETAKRERWLRDPFESAVREVSPPIADIFANLTHPEAGVRHGPLALVRHFNTLSVTTVRHAEKKLELFCEEMSWSVAPVPEDTLRRAEAVAQGHDRWKAVRTLMATTRDKGWGIARFEQELAAISPDVLKIFINLTRPLGENRLGLMKMGFTNSPHLSGWEEELEAFCEEMGWSTSPQPHKYKERVEKELAGRERWGRVMGVVQQSRQNHWTIQEFDQALHSADESMSIVFRNLLRPANERFSQKDLAAEFHVNPRTIVVWEKGLRRICQEMDWQEPEERYRGPTKKLPGGVTIAPDASEKVRVADLVAKLTQVPKGFAPLDGEMCKNRPFITPAELKKVAALENIPVQLKTDARGYAPSRVEWKDLATKPSVVRFTGSFARPELLPSPSKFETLLIGLVALLPAIRFLRFPNLQFNMGVGNLFLSQREDWGRSGT